MAYLLKFRMQQRGSYASIYSSASDYESDGLRRSISPSSPRDERISMLLEECFSAARAGNEVEKKKPAIDAAAASRETSFDSRRSRKSAHILAMPDKQALTPEDIIRADACTSGVTSSSATKPALLRLDSTEQVNHSSWDSDSDEEGSSHGNKRRSIWSKAGDRLSAVRPKSMVAVPPPRPGRSEQQMYHVPKSAKLTHSPSFSSLEKGERKFSVGAAEPKPTVAASRDAALVHSRQPSDSTTVVAGNSRDECGFKILHLPNLSLVNSQAESAITMGERRPVPRSATSADEVLACLAQGMAPPGMPEDPSLVTWSGPDDAENPRNWGKLKRWLITLVVTACTLVANMGIATPAPALGLLSQQYGINDGHLRAMMVTAFLLAFAVARELACRLLC